MSLLPRNAQAAVEVALADTRVVVLLGARQVGKSTLMRQVAAGEGRGRPVLTFDAQTVRTAASADPAGFVAGLPLPVALDEIQRVPELLTEIKLRVDRDPAPGQFLLTGSANLLEMAQVKDSLAGRVEYLRLHPFSQGELREQKERFVAQLGRGGVPSIFGAPSGRSAYAGTLARGGYPEVQHRSASRRARFFESYLESIIERDVRDLADVADRTAILRVLQAIAAISAGELNVDKLSSSLEQPASTVRRYIDLLEMLFLVRRVPAWSTNLLARTIKRPKIYVTDPGLLAYLVGADERRIERDLGLGGMFFETFAMSEIQRQISWLDDRPRMFHFRDREQREVDLVLEYRDGAVAGIEVKAAATVTPHDFRGLQYLRDKLGDRFVAGTLLYSGENTVSFGDRLTAVPLCGLWQTAPDPSAGP